MRFWQKNLHEHKDGIIHSHDHNGLHTHDENGIAHDLPDFESMTKKAIDDWAKEINIDETFSDLLVDYLLYDEDLVKKQKPRCYRLIQEIIKNESC